MNTIEELRLVKELKSGNKESLSLLWDEINPKLYGYLVNTLRDRSVADDILQETWLKAITKLDKFKIRGIKFSAWLFAIARNECRLYWRNNKKVSSVDLADVNLVDNNSLLGINNNLLVESILNKLDPAEQEILQLRFIGQFDFKEIAKILGISVVNARVKLYRCLKKAQLYIK